MNSPGCASNAVEVATLAPPSLVATDRVEVRAAAGASRVVFIDLARALAVLFMVQGHAINVLLDPAYAEGALAATWLFLRGLTSCMFLTLSGAAFAVVTSRRWESHLTLSLGTWRRVRRFAFFAMLGYAMHLPVSRFHDLPLVLADGWRSFFAVDILQTIGLTLIALQLLVIASGTRLRFAIASAVLGVGAVVITPAAWSLDWTLYLPLGLAAYMSEATGSLFPLLPWVGFVFAGVLIGLAYDAWGASAPATFVHRLLLPVGTVLLVLGFVWQGTTAADGGLLDFQRQSPGFFLVRLGSVLGLLGGLALLSQRLSRVPSAITALSQESLLVYFVHVSLLYGSVWNPGLLQLLGTHYGPGPTVAWIAALLGAMTLMAWLWSQTKRSRPAIATLVRLGAASALTFPLL